MRYPTFINVYGGSVEFALTTNSIIWVCLKCADTLYIYTIYVYMYCPYVVLSLIKHTIKTAYLMQFI